MPAVLDPEEIVVLTNHGAMKLRSAVARAMALLPEDRDGAIIVRKGALSQSILGFEQIKQLAEQWEYSEHPLASPAAEVVIAFGPGYLRPRTTRP